MGMGMGMFLCNANISLLLMALALGYLVLYFANREEKSLKNLGFIIGVVIIVFASLMIIGKIVQRVHNFGKCGGKMMMMPMQMMKN